MATSEIVLVTSLSDTDGTARAGLRFQEGSNAHPPLSIVLTCGHSTSSIESHRVHGSTKDTHRRVSGRPVIRLQTDIDR